MWILGSLAISMLAVVACSTSTTTKVDGDDYGGSGGDQGSAGASQTGGGGTPPAGGGGSQGGQANTGGMAGSSTGAEVLSCSAYCKNIFANCNSDTSRQFGSDVSCLKTCAAFRVGNANETSGNSLGCRAHFAALAANDESNCAAAGPSGGGVCGTPCDAYCAIMQSVCTSVYEDASVCRSACIQMSGISEKKYVVGISGDNVQCRLYHATFAAEGFPDIHCPHAASTPTSPCAD
jgi:hypothetical protein